MFATTEIRWFLRGDIPAEVLGWFHERDAKSPEQPARTDHYLALPGDTMGIKLREGLLEHKQKGGGDDTQWNGMGCSGMISHWQKWSFAVEDKQALRDMLQTYPLCWKGIEKTRSLHLLEPDAAGGLKFIEYEEAGANACGWELAEVQAEGSAGAWWTVGFEAYGEKDKRLDMLKGILGKILREDMGEYLRFENSFSYPEWIAGI